MFRFLAVIVLGFATASTANAALLRNIQGPVAVNTGDGFRIVSTTVTVNPGDRIRIGEGGSAEIVYDNGCVQVVPASSVRVIPTSIECQPPATDGGAANTALLVLGGAAVVGGVVALAGGGGGDKPASP